MTRSPRALAAVALLAVVAALPIATTTGPATAAETTASAVTKSGAGDFAGLSVTVSQTKNLINQVVEVSWKGGAPTEPATGNLAVNFLQVFQCWGDAADGPRREQCQFGGFAGDTRGGQNVTSRQTNQGGVVDPRETYVTTGSGNAFVPFEAVSGKVATGARNEFFDQSTTNEIPLARTRPDGSGLEYVEVQTAREAAGLGCGEPLTVGGATVGRSCWLVVVPRGNKEVDGSTRTTSAINQLESSALSATNWAQRLTFPLQFEPLGLSCPLGASERRTVGNEPVVEAISRWQPTLCAGGERVFGFSQVPEATGRRVLAGDDPGVVFVGREVEAEELAGRAPAYAPVTLSGMGVAFNIDSLARSDAPTEVQLRDATRIGELQLTPRLVAKLITQSYRLAVDFQADSVKGNPLDMTRDPEFQALNPGFALLTYPAIAEVLLPTGLTDDARHVWEWLRTDAEARAFLAGAPDPSGMTVNPNYKGISLPQDGFPKADPYCREFTTDQPDLCTLDAHPYAADLHDAARSAARGDTLARTDYQPLAIPPGYKKNTPQPVGGRYALALTDTASAARYGIPMAKLRNASGEFVAPTTASMLAAAATLPAPTTAAAPQVATDVKAAAAYPLSFLTYAATVPSALDAQARADYAVLLRYAVEGGQQPGDAPGQLPRGYAPLPASLRSTTLALATLLEKPVVAAPTSAPTATPATVATSAPVTPVVSGGGVSGPAPVVPVTVPPVVPAPLPVPQTAPTAAPVAPVPATLAAARPLPVGVADQYSLLLATFLGALAVLTGPMLRRRSR
ncbi:MAG: hypothetical protein Q8R60_12585 [Mycobacteriales bacterium]|nr:hypothetical protein [Mycobacteriales bacterium]